MCQTGAALCFLPHKDESRAGRACLLGRSQPFPSFGPSSPAADNISGRTASSEQTTPGGSAVPSGAQTPPLSGEAGSKPHKYEPQLSLIPYCNTKTIHFIRHGWVLRIPCAALRAVVFKLSPAEELSATLCDGRGAKPSVHTASVGILRVRQLVYLSATRSSGRTAWHVRAGMTEHSAGSQRLHICQPMHSPPAGSFGAPAGPRILHAC